MLTKTLKSVAGCSGAGSTDLVELGVLAGLDSTGPQHDRRTGGAAGSLLVQHPLAIGEPGRHTTTAGVRRASITNSAASRRSIPV